MKFKENNHTSGIYKKLYQNGHALQYVKEQTKEICIAALENKSYLPLPNESGGVLEYVDESLKEDVLNSLPQLKNSIIKEKLKI